MRMKLLLIEDDTELAHSIKLSLQESYSVSIESNGENGLFAAINSIYDLIIIDISLPDIDGLVICREIRKHNKKIPILFLSGFCDVDIKFSAFIGGGDDYLTKPFDKKELIARLKSLLRRYDQRDTLDSLRLGDLIIDLDHHTVIRQGKQLTLRRKEFNILAYLARNADKVITRDKLQSYIWGDDTELSGNTIDVHINYLRDKVDKPFNSHLIQTVHGIGYRFNSSIK